MRDGEPTLPALTYAGPEGSTLNTSFGNDAIRYYNDVAMSCKYSDKLTLNGPPEIQRGNGNFFVSTPAGNPDLANSGRRRPAGVACKPARAATTAR